MSQRWRTVHECSSQTCTAPEAGTQEAACLCPALPTWFTLSINQRRLEPSPGLRNKLFLSGDPVLIGSPGPKRQSDRFPTLILVDSKKRFTKERGKVPLYPASHRPWAMTRRQAACSLTWGWGRVPFLRAPLHSATSGALP